MSKHEERLKNIFENIEVDETRLKNVRTRLETKPRLRFAPRLAVIIVAITILLAGTMSAAVYSGILDRFVSEHNPRFGGILQPAFAHATDQGIRIDIIASARFGNYVVLYLSMQDISGQNRLQENSEMVSFLRQTPWPSAFGHGSGFAFDAQTNTVYFEKHIPHDTRNPIRLDYNFIEISGGFIEEIPIPLDEINYAELVEGLSARHRVLQPHPPQDSVLLPNGLYDTPQWVSNIGLAENRLHVQLGSIFGHATADVVLYNPHGEQVHSPYGFSAQTDANMRFVSVDGSPYFAFMESAFPVNINELENYILKLRLFYREGFLGNWQLEVNPDETGGEVRRWQGLKSVAHEETHYEVAAVYVTPIGVRWVGTYSYENIFSRSVPQVSIEKANGKVSLGFSIGSFRTNPATFDFLALAPDTINVSEVTSVTIGDTVILLTETPK